MSMESKKGRRGQATFLLIGVAAIIGSMAGFVAIDQLRSERAVRRAAPPTPVTVAAVSELDFAQTIEAVGNVRANESVNLTARVTDALREINFESGQEVRENDVVAALTDVEETAALEEAVAALREAERDLERANALKARQAVSVASLDDARAAVEQAQARVHAIKARVEDRVIVAPFDGVLGLRLLSPGTLVQPGDVVATLDDVSVMKLDFNIPERFLSSVRLGQTIHARSPAFPGLAIEGSVSSIDSRIDPETRTVTIRAMVPNEERYLRPGMLLAVDLEQNRRMTPAAPEASVLRTQEAAYVFVVESAENGTVARRRAITIGGRRPGFVEVTEGLEVGDTVIVDGVHRVRPGGPVEVTGRSERDAPTGREAASASRSAYASTRAR